MSCVAVDWSTPSGTTELEAVLRGDRQAWLRFYRRYHPLISASVLHVLRSRNIRFTRDDVQDHVSEVWLALLRRDAVGLRRFDPSRGRSLPSWLRLLAVRSTIDQLRGRAMQQKLRESEGEVERSDESERPDLAAEMRQQLEVAGRALARLKPRDRRFMELCLCDTDAADVARELNIAVATVHSRRFKIGQKLCRMVRQQRRPRVRGGSLRSIGE